MLDWFNSWIIIKHNQSDRVSFHFQSVCQDFAWCSSKLILNILFGNTPDQDKMRPFPLNVYTNSKPIVVINHHFVLSLRYCHTKGRNIYTN